MWREYVFGGQFDTSGRKYLAVSLVWSKGHLEVKKWPEVNAPPDAPRLFERTIRVARQITTRKDFKGFTLRDLRVIAIVMVAAIEG